MCGRGAMVPTRGNNCATEQANTDTCSVVRINKNQGWRNLSPKTRRGMPSIVRLKEGGGRMSLVLCWGSGSVEATPQAAVVSSSSTLMIASSSYLLFLPFLKECQKPSEAVDIQLTQDVVSLPVLVPVVRLCHWRYPTLSSVSSILFYSSPISRLSFDSSLRSPN